MKTLFTTLTFLVSTFLFAQFPVATLYETINDINHDLPPLLGSMIDTTVLDPIEITRTTKYISDWDWYPHHEYAKIQPWNADATIYKFYSVAIYDAQTHQLLNEIQDAGSIYPTYWSNTDPDIMYSFMSNGDIKTYSVSEQQVNLLDHIYYNETDLIDYDKLKLGPGEGNIDKNDHYVVLVGKTGTDLDVIVYDLQELEIIHKETFTGAWGSGDGMPEYIDWVSVSQSGNYVGIMWDHGNTDESNPFNGHYGVEIYNTNDLQFLRRIVEYGNHGDFGYAQNGDEVFVQFWGSTGRVNMYYLDRLERLVIQTDPDFGQHGHISCRNLNRPGWAYVSIDELGYGVMMAVKLDDSGLVEYFGHHYSSLSNYRKASNPVPTPNGEKIMFKSDFGDMTTEVVYVFEAKKYQEIGIHENQEISFEIAPNPVNDFLSISTNTKIGKIKIYNSIGQTVKIYDLDKTKITINLTGLQSGIYMFFANVKNRQIKKLFIKK